jgi:malonyl-CoA O-methyltransferase
MQCRLDKRWVGRSFGAAARGYDGVAELQRGIGERLLSRLPDECAPAVIADVGAGTGYCAARLRERYPEARLVLVDIAEGMLRTARERIGPAALCLLSDAEALPLAGEAVDLLVSNLALQWCPDLKAVFGEFRRVLKPGGILLFSTFGAGTLAELRRAWAVADPAHTHVNEFAGLPAIAAALEAAGFAQAELESQARRLEYPDVHALMRELKGLGAHNVTAARPRQLTGKDRLRRMVEVYPGEMGGAVGASFEVVYGRATKER